MLTAIRIATKDLVEFLEARMPSLSADWWEKHVVDRLSFQQQRTVTEQGYKTLRQLDFAALLRVLDQNWYELSNTLRLPREGRTWVKELQTVRNKWAHLSSEAMPASEVYRDADTLWRLLAMIGADAASLDAVEAVKANALATMAANATSPTEPMDKLDGLFQTGNDTARPALWSFKVGDVVALRSSPNIQVPVIEVIAGGPECRYRVFQNNTKATYYESQLQAISAQAEGRETLTI